MSPDTIVIPILAMISGIVSLFIDPKDSKIKWIKPLMLSLIVLSALAAIYSGYQNQIDANKKDSRYEQDMLNLRQENRALRQELIDMPQKIVERIVALTNKGYGYIPSTAASATNEQVLQSEKANSQLKSVTQEVTNQDIGRRQLITVQYFPKEVDPTIVQSTLKELGFNIQVSKSNISNIPTNAIWFGSKVNIEDVKIVAYTLIRAGVKIKTIKPFRGNPGEPKSSLIQVGTDADYADKPALSVSEIRNATEFTRKE